MILKKSGQELDQSQTSVKLKLTIFPPFKKVANLLTILVLLPTFSTMLFLMWVETLTKIFHRGIAVLPLF